MEEEILKAKQLISEAKNVYIILNDLNEPEDAASALALFFSLKKIDKNVNLIAEDIPEKIKFLLPSADFVSLPKNFVLSIPKSAANISQVYYENNGDNLKIHLSLEKGTLKKDDISFYYSEAKPDLIITLNINDFKEHMLKRLNPYGFLLGSPVLNFGNSLTIASLLKSIDENMISKETANCLLAGLIIHTDNFKNDNITADVFELAGLLMKKGADLKNIINNIYGGI